MCYKVLILRKVAKELKRLPIRSREAVAERIAALGRNPDAPALDIKPLTNHPQATFRLRVGSYRVLFNRDDDIRIVEIRRVAHRKEVY